MKKGEIFPDGPPPLARGDSGETPYGLAGILIAMKESALQEKTLTARAAEGDNGSVSALLTLRYSPISTASAFAGALGLRPGELNIANLRGLSFLRDMVATAAYSGSACGTVVCEEIRTLARSELKRRRAWRIRDQIRLVIFEMLFLWRTESKPHRPLQGRADLEV
jgi:hypothetical protein